ncbi:helix-turn-helix transcriptional regulator [Pseudonocardia alaniniphila]|uniref:Helix-turn-helix transcriptional regulator n=1 Tax=Pseudonocardia alaniniphila TaxID=75291 RepID=A0ABS9T9F6_9PSEU|nr:helix-turn-helix transcriptional regulator [Pseudonocardia alaniniphila]MCH6165147.1 helix-turn-helix transcriptional regulator [Pseudonocardia alaniniphila]
MDQRSEIREFLASRRARITPEQVGLPHAGSRRVPGLRREEVAILAGVGVDYYTRIERGNLRGVSDGVLEAIARALQLDEPERTHLFDLARAGSTPARPRRRRSQNQIRPGVQRMVDAMVGVPAFVHNGRTDVLAVNPLGRALYAPMFDTDVRPVNSARFTFLDGRAREFYRDWDRIASDAVAILHTEAGKHPDDRDLSDLVGELSTRSDVFRKRWAEHDVRYHDTGLKRLHHSVLGDLDLTYEVAELRGDQDLTLFVYGAEPQSPSADGLEILASWAASRDQTDVDSPTQ